MIEANKVLMVYPSVETQSITVPVKSSSDELQRGETITQAGTRCKRNTEIGT